MTVRYLVLGADGGITAILTEAPEGPHVVRTVPDDYPERQSWNPTTATFAPDDAKAVARLRAERDRRLSASDWTQLADAPLTAAKKAAWRVWRQALRDLPATIADPHAAVLPEPPQ